MTVMEPASRHWVTTLLRGFRQVCPNCGEGRLFKGYVKPQETCTACGLRLDQFRADDAPAYFTILLVGHVIVPGMLMLEMAYHPPTAVHMVLWLPLTLILTLLLLPRIKGMLIAVQWALKIPS